MILEVLHEIPYEFARAIEAEQRFPNAADLRQSVTHLYNTLVEKLGILIPILLRTHPEKNKLAKLWKQHPGKEQVVVQACLVEISRASKRVERCSAAALERTVGEIHRHIVDISGKTIHIIGKMDAWDGKMSSAIQNSKSELITWAKDQWQQYLGYNG
ncbi:hypothetical protein DL546_008566 [Coniochaeta pulveracea]|uniref:Uncharacterized protein n=1 Tax=Coniochaeta pulveracea TaxID=177199 RepID=A0A420YG76_9PEZI|nr:hypothetical protein DL546_008566 [Coniochaeta pulveracea]